MEEEVRDAVFGNVGTTVAFRVGPFDAETLETIFAPQFEATDLVNLGFAQIYLTLMIRGVGSPPFSSTTLPPFDPPPERHVDEVIRASRATYGRPRAEVEKVIDEWQKSDPAPPEPPKPKRDYRPVAKPAAPMPAPPLQAPKKEESPMHPPEKKPYLPPVKTPQKPHLDGSKSLREALAQVTNSNHTKPPVQPPPSGLKEALQKVSPKKDELSPETISQMLDVDEPKDTR